MREFTNAGYRFEVTDTPAAAGTGQVAVLLHGFPADRHCWDRVSPALAAAGYRVLAFDQRGYSPGARPAARRAYRLHHLASDALALADAAGAHRFHLIGHDWGAALGWYLAGRYPDRVRSLACLSVPHPRAFVRALVGGDQAVRSWYMAAVQPPVVPEWVLGRRHGGALRRALTRSGLDSSTANRYADRGALRGPLNWYRALPFDLGSGLGRTEVPTLYVWSDRDRFVSRTAARLCGRYVSGRYRYEVLSGVSHWIPEQAPERTAALLVKHFSDATG